MTWFKVDDHLHAHRKAVLAGTEAMGLWVLAGSWSAAEESDGWVPGYMLARLAGGNADQLAERLVTAGLWHPDEHDGVTGYRFHQWAEHQPTRAQLEAKREAQRERMRRVRANSTTATGPAKAAEKPAPRKRPEVPETFNEFWSAYPRKVGKDAAAKSYARALTQVSHETILTGLANSLQVWQAEKREPQYLPHAATWLNQGRWADEVPLPDMPQATRPTATMNLCSDPGCAQRHEWHDKHGNRFMCVGAA